MHVFPLFAAFRYLFSPLSPKKQAAIHVISIISVVGVAVATAALVCVLSVFNGFHDLLESLYTAFDAQLRIVPSEGSTFPQSDKAVEAVRRRADVAAWSDCYQQEALVVRNGKALVVTLKGVDDNFAEATDIVNILYGEGRFVLSAAGLNYAVPGIGFGVGQLGGSHFGSLTVYAPREGERVNLANPATAFREGTLYASGLLFDVAQKQYNDNLILVALPFAQKLYGKAGQLTELDIRLRPGVPEEKAKRSIQEQIGSRYRVEDRAEQQAETYAIMNIEKYIAWLVLSFILLVACFNIIGAVSILVIDKRADMRTLVTLGAPETMISRIFLLQGRLIALLGAVSGILLGLGLCFAQQRWGLVALGDGSVDYIVQAYPVCVRVSDIAAVLLTVIVVGFTAVWWPVRYLTRFRL